MAHIEKGNIHDNDQYRSWFIGDFIDTSSFFNSTKAKKFEVKWSERKKGCTREAKEIPEDDLVCKSVGILIYGKCRLGFRNEKGSFDTYIVERPGDYIAWAPNVPHTVEALEDFLIINIRWYE